MDTETLFELKQIRMELGRITQELRTNNENMAKIIKFTLKLFDEGDDRK